MAEFAYRAADVSGRIVSGWVTATDADSARKKLSRKSLAVVSLDKSAKPDSAPTRAKTGYFAPRLSAKQLSLFTRQLATLVAVMPLEEALSTLLAQAEKPGQRVVLGGLHQKVEEGFKLSAALASAPKSFSPLYVSMVAAGETSGGLDAVLENLADLLDRQAKVRATLTTALAYPAALAVIAMAVIIAMMTLVVPKLVEQFDTMGQSLPWLTEAVIFVSNFLVSYGWVLLIAAVLVAIVGFRALQNPPVRMRFDTWLLGVPLIGTILKRTAAARLARTMAVMINNGMPVVDGLAATAKTIGNRRVQRAYEEAIVSIREGGTISAALKRTDICPPILIHMAASGEQSGRLAALLDRAGETLEREFDTATSTALSLLEPLIIVLMGGIVTVIVLAILLPILRLNVLAIG